VLVETICPVQVPAFLRTSGRKVGTAFYFHQPPLLAFLYFLR